MLFRSLEAAAAGAPLAVSATGGLAEIVHPGVTGMTFPAKDPEALAEAVGALLCDQAGARRMARRALAMVESRYGWASIAEQTADAYRATVAGAPENRAQARARVAAQRQPIVVPEGNLLALDGAGI